MNYRSIPLAAALLAGCGGQSISAIDDGSFFVVLHSIDVDDNGVIDESDRAVFSAVVYDAARDGCPKFRGKPEMTIDGMEMQQTSTGAFTGYDLYFTGRTCDSAPTWEFAGTNFFTDDVDTSVVELTQGNKSLTFEIEELRRPPTVEMIVPEDGVIEPGAPVTFEYGPPTQILNTKPNGGTDVLLYKEPGAPEYLICPEDAPWAICHQTDLTFDGAQISFNAPQFCADGTFRIAHPSRELAVSCPDNFSCEGRLPTGVAYASRETTAEVAFPGDYVPAPCEVWMSHVQVGGDRVIAPGTVVALRDVVVDTPDWGGGFYVEDLDGGALVYSGIAVEYDPAAIGDLPIVPEEIVDLIGVYEEVSDRRQADDTRSQIRITSADGFLPSSTFTPYGIDYGLFMENKDWKKDNFLEQLEGVRVNLHNVTVESCCAGGEAQLGENRVLGELFQPLDVTGGDSFESVTGILRYSDGRYVLHPRWADDFHL